MTNQLRASYLYGLFSDLTARLSDRFNLRRKTADDIKHRLRIKEEMRDAGLSPAQLRYAEVRHLPSIIKNDEHVKAAIFGHIKSGGVAIMVATNRRVIYIDHTPMVDNLDEFNYLTISGISYSSNRLSCAVTMHSSLDDRTLERVKNHQAKKFISYIETKSIDLPSGASDIGI